MYRILAIFVAILAFACSRAEAIEMFTNFHNGENIGFPPMQVPYSIYGGIGHGGWNPHAVGIPQKGDPYVVPAMSPTGQLPGRQCFNYYGSAPACLRDTTGKADQQPLVSDRRRGRWQRGGTNSEIEGNGSEPGNSLPPSEHAANHSQPPSANGGLRRGAGSIGNAEPSGPAVVPSPMPTIVHAQSAESEFFSHIPTIEGKADRPSNSEAGINLPPTKQNSESLAWPRADALFPHHEPAHGDAG